MNTISVREAKQKLSHYLRTLNGGGVVISRHGKPCGALLTFKDEDELLEFQLANDPKFLALVHRSFLSGRVSQADVRRRISARERRERMGRRRAT